MEIIVTYGGPQGAPGVGVTPVLQEVPTGTQNGINQTFTLAHPPTGIVMVYFNGREYQDTTDYSVSGTTLTLTAFAPNSSEGDRFWVNYYY